MKLAVIVAVTAGLAPSPAPIDATVTVRVPDATVTTRLVLRRANSAADAYWTRQGIPSRCSSTTLVLTDMLDVRARAYDWACTIALARAEAAIPPAREYPRAWTLQAICALLTHEAGHLRGLEHDHAGGIMDPDHMDDQIVPECREEFPRSGQVSRRVGQSR